MKVYLDTCCLNRSFDDQNQPRIRLESEAITLVMEKFHRREWEWIGSDVLAFEIGQTRDLERKEKLLLLSGQAHQFVETDDKILARAEILESFGFGGYDAIHLASAERANVDVFLTTDDRLQKAADRRKSRFSFTIINPVKWLEEVLK